MQRKSGFVIGLHLYQWRMAKAGLKGRVNRRSAIQLIGLVIAGVATSSFLRNRRSVGENVGDLATVKDIRADQSSPATHVPGADVTIISFNDYACTACRIAHPALQKAMAEDGRSQIIYKDWPIFGPASERAAQVALAADYQGIYAPFHNVLMTGYGLTDAQLQSAVKKSGGNWEQILGDLEIHQQDIENQLNKNRLQAFGLGLEGTPAYLIGPILVRGSVTTGDFQKAIKEARSLLK